LINPDFWHMVQAMDWKENILKWRVLSPERKLQLRWEAIPASVVRTMAFENEPVSEEMVREIFARIEPPALLKKAKTSPATTK
jgi:hypothetical protein